MIKIVFDLLSIIFQPTKITLTYVFINDVTKDKDLGILDAKFKEIKDGNRNKGIEIILTTPIISEAHCRINIYGRKLV